MAIRASYIDELYKIVIDQIMRNGSQVTARELDFKELTFQHLILTDPRARIVQNPARNINRRFMVGEFIWMMSSSPWLSEIAFYNKNMAKFSDDGISLHGAYGPRLRHYGQPSADLDQLSSCLQRLKDDIYTRQAVIAILDPAIDFTVKTKDIPCNNLLQFLYRDNALHLSCYVRSNDMMLGFPYDVHHWTLLQELFASALGVKLGEYHHFVGSLHVYNSDFERARAILDADNFDMGIMPPMPPGQDLSIIDELRMREKSYRESNVLPNKLHPYWQAYIQNIVKPLKSGEYRKQDNSL